MASSRRNVQKGSGARSSAGASAGGIQLAIDGEVVDFVSYSEFDALRRAARRRRERVRDELLICLLFYHGLRASEASALRVRDVDLDEARLRVRRLKGGRGTTHPIPGDELRLLRRYLRVRPSPRLPWLLLSNRQAQLARNTIYTICRALGERAGLSRAVHPHMLRHGCGFHLANQGHDARLIQDYLGHRDPKVSMEYTKIAAVRFEGLWE